MSNLQLNRRHIIGMMVAGSLFPGAALSAPRHGVEAPRASVHTRRIMRDLERDITKLMAPISSRPFGYPIVFRKNDTTLVVSFPWSTLSPDQGRAYLDAKGVDLVTSVCELLISRKDWRGDISAKAFSSKGGYQSAILAARRAESFRATMISRGIRRDILSSNGVPLHPSQADRARIDLTITLEDRGVRKTRLKR